VSRLTPAYSAASETFNQGFMSQPPDRRAHQRVPLIPLLRDVRLSALT
jgi:hypothetical protein